MFIRKKKNNSGSFTIQLVEKIHRQNSIKKTFGTSSIESEIEFFLSQAQAHLHFLSKQSSLDFSFEEDLDFIKNLRKGFKSIQVIGPELILGKIFDSIGFFKISSDLFRHLVITRLIYPGSKLKTVDYLLQYKGIYTNEDRIYRFMDHFKKESEQKAIDIVYNHTKKILGNKIIISFYDVTTLYFEASNEDDFRVTGFSKDGKPQHPQIVFALLVGENGHPLAYEIYEGGKYEGHTLIPVIERFKEKYNLSNLIVVADAGLLSKENIETLIKLKYPFILGGRPKNESDSIKSFILSQKYKNGTTITINKSEAVRLIINYSEKRAKKDEHNRSQGIKRLEKKFAKGFMKKEEINKRGYNKYLIIKAKVPVAIDYKAFERDKMWNGLKGYVTNCDLTAQQIMDHYKQLWNIEKAFRISKTDLMIRPIFHRLERRIKTHICLAFCSYKIYKELERILKESKSEITVEKAIRALKTIYEGTIILPASKKQIKITLPLNAVQKELLKTFVVE